MKNSVLTEYSKQARLFWPLVGQRLCLLSLILAALSSQPVAATGPFIEVTDPAEHPFPPSLIVDRLVFADLDSDGDLDAMSGQGSLSIVSFDQPIRYFENVGNARQPDFLERTDADNPLNGMIGNTPAWVDLDNDGDLDAVVGAFDGTVQYFQNIGSRVQPAFMLATDNPFADVMFEREPRSTLNPFAGSIAGDVVLSFIDADGDGNLDIVTGDEDGILRRRAFPLPPSLCPFDEQAAASLLRIYLICRLNENTGALRYFENTGNVTTPRYVERIEQANLFAGVNLQIEATMLEVPRLGADTGSSGLANETQTVLFDWDKDGDQDILLSFVNGFRSVLFVTPSDLFTGETTFNYFENTGTDLSPLYIQRIGFQNTFAGLNEPMQTVSWGLSTLTPTATQVDLDGDGDQDIAVIMVRDLVNVVRYFKNLSEFPGYALLIQGRNATGEQLAEHRQITDQLYQTLLQQGLQPENIYCNSWPVPGLADNPNCPPLSAGMVSPTELQARLNEKPGPLKIILIGQSDAIGSFLTDDGNGGIFTPAIMSDWLAMIESSLTPSALSATRTLVLGYEHVAQTVAALATPELARPGWRILPGTASQATAIVDALPQLPNFACAINLNTNCNPIFIEANQQLLLGEVTLLNFPGLQVVTAQFERQADGSFLGVRFDPVEPAEHSPVFDAATDILTIPRLTLVTDTAQRLENIQLILVPGNEARFQFVPGSTAF